MDEFNMPWDLAELVGEMTVADRQILLERMDDIAFDADLPMPVRQLAEAVRETIAEATEADQRTSGAGAEQVTDLPPGSELIVSTYMALPADQRGAYFAEVNATDVEVVEIFRRASPEYLAALERVTRNADSDTAALLHGLVIRMARGDDPHVAMRELAKAIPGFYENEETGGKS